MHTVHIYLLMMLVIRTSHFGYLHEWLLFLYCVNNMQICLYLHLTLPCVGTSVGAVVLGCKERTISISQVPILRNLTTCHYSLTWCTSEQWLGHEAVKQATSRETLCVVMMLPWYNMIMLQTYVSYYMNLLMRDSWYRCTLGRNCEECSDCWAFELKCCIYTVGSHFISEHIGTRECSGNWNNIIWMQSRLHSI